MIFSGPKAASPPKNTPSRVDSSVTLSTMGMSQLSNSRPMSLSMKPKAFSWPMARITESQGTVTSLSFFDLSLPSSSSYHSTSANLTPTSLPSSTMNSSGAWLVTISTFSSIASSNSQSDALSISIGLRAITLTSLPPKRKEVRQQSMAVLPPPMTTTLSPMEFV